MSKRTVWSTNQLLSMSNEQVARLDLHRCARCYLYKKAECFDKIPSGEYADVCKSCYQRLKQKRGY